MTPSEDFTDDYDGQDSYCLNDNDYTVIKTEEILSQSNDKGDERLSHSLQLNGAGEELALCSYHRVCVRPTDVATNQGGLCAYAGGPAPEFSRNFPGFV